MIERLKIFLPIIGSMLILVGTFKVILYYIFFGFNVSPFLEFSEILVLFTHDIVVMALMLAPGIVISLPYDSNRKISKGRSDALLKAMNENNWWQRIHQNFIFLEAYPVILVFSVTLGIFFIFFESLFIFYLYIYISFIGFYFIIIVLNEVNRTSWHTNHKPISQVVFWFVLVTFMVLLLVTLKTHHDYQEVSQKKMYYGTEIHTNDLLYKSDSTSYFIGKVKNYIFIKNESSGSIEVIPMKEIVSLKIYKNKSHISSAPVDTLKTNTSDDSVNQLRDTISSEI